MSDELTDTIFGILHNEGDGGIWEHFDSVNAEEVAKVLGPALLARGWKREAGRPHAAPRIDTVKYRGKA